MIYDAHTPTFFSNEKTDRLSAVLKYTNEIGKKALLENKKARQKQWTPEKKSKQARIIQKYRPWERTTGPKTIEGKAKSAQNALKHGFRSRDYAELCRLLRLQDEYVRQVRQKIKREAAWYDRNTAMTKTLADIYSKTKRDFAAGGLETPELDARLLISHYAGLDHADFITKGDMEVAEAVSAQIETAVQRRLKGEPVSRILGVREFWGLEFDLSPATLDPRPDTETLVEAALKWVRETGREKEALRIVDLGTGSGCIPIALLTELPHAVAIGLDYSHEAARAARRNAEKLGVGERFMAVQGDWMAALKEGEFDLIVSNPPYISPSDFENLTPEVKNHDPILALKAEKNGIEAYEKIIFQLKNHLNAQNRAFLEIGFGQRERVLRLVDDSNLRHGDSVPDIAGIPRVVEIWRGDK
jgi:release factor glutamine methyltransferase